MSPQRAGRPESLPWGAIGAISAALAIPVMIIIALVQAGVGGGSDGAQSSSPRSAYSGGTPGRVTTTDVAAGAPGNSAAQRGAAKCVRTDGSPVSCGDADALVVTSATSCDLAGATRALGADPATLELLLDPVPYDGACAVGPTAAARAAGAITADVLALRGGEVRSALVACWPDTPNSPVVSCATPHRYEPVSAWAPVGDAGRLAETCSSAAALYVAGPVNVAGEPLVSLPLTTDESPPRYRCAVVSAVPLAGSVYRLSGRELPVAR